MKKIILIVTALLGWAIITEAQAIVNEVVTSDFQMKRNGDYMSVDMTLNLSDLKVVSNRAVLLTPRIVNGTDSIELPSVGIYGRRRYYFYVRNNKSMLTGKDETSYKASDKPDKLTYHNMLPYAEWMNGAELSLLRRDWGCCNTLLDKKESLLGKYEEPILFIPELIYVRPQAEAAKHRTLEGSAYIDFPVNKTTIYPDYRRNTVELGKIYATIDSVRKDTDVIITSVWLKGYASPESPYSHNRDLAIGRTEALKNYIRQFYMFEDGIIATDYEPEDWAGLQRYVEQSNLNHRAEILAIIEEPIDPDMKEAKIKRNYPEEYKFLLDNCYPALRHTDYRISYNIRNYSDIEEIRQLIKTQPQKLSLNEFYLVAQEYEPGTEEFINIFETAVRMYPNDTTANLNAANTAMQRNDYASAERYLAKAGDSKEAIYARGIYAFLTEEYDTAEKYLRQADAAGIEYASAVLEQIKKQKSRQ